MVVDSNLKAVTLVGYVDRDTIDQAVVDAIRASGGSLIKNPYFRRLDAICASGNQQVKALQQPSAAAAIPAYLVGVQGVVAGHEDKTTAIKPPHKYVGFHAAFKRYLGDSVALDQLGRRPLQDAGRHGGQDASPSAARRWTRSSRSRTARTASAASRPRAYTRRVSAEGFTEHLEFPQGKGYVPAGAFMRSRRRRLVRRPDLAVAGGRGRRVTGAGFEASGCGAMVAAGSAAVALVSGASVLDAARVGTAAIAAELGGLSPGKLHAAELAADALHRALGAGGAGRRGGRARSRPRRWSP